MEGGATEQVHSRGFFQIRTLWKQIKNSNKSRFHHHQTVSTTSDLLSVLTLFCFDHYHHRGSHRQGWTWKRRVQSLFHQEAPRPPQSIRALPELRDAAIRGPGGAHERQSEGRGRRARRGHGQQRPRQPQECQQRPLWPGGRPCRRLEVRTGFTARADTLITDCLTATYGVEGKKRVGSEMTSVVGQPTQGKK